MLQEIVISGFGGQGVLSMGKILAFSGIMEDKEVSWFPAYGPEQRGGTANVTVIISDKPISSPVVNQYDVAIVLNQPSLDKFESRVKPGGTLIFDSNGFKKFPTRTDINIYKVDATEYAYKNDMIKTLNMMILGGFLRIRPIVQIENVIKGLTKSLPERHHHLIPMNEKSILTGMEIVEKYNP